MRSMIIALGVVALAAGSFAVPATAAKSKMGCEVGKEVWNAAEGKCLPGTASAKTAKKPAAKKK